MSRSSLSMDPSVVTFIDRFISFTCELALTERDVYERARRKLPRHDREDPRHFYAKVLAGWYLHRPSLVVASEPVDDSTPRLFIKAPEGHYELWADVGQTSPRRLRQAARMTPRPELFHFYYEDAQLAPLLTALRGSTENWVEPIHFLKLDASLLEQIVELETTSQQWSFTMPDDQTLYLSVDGNVFSSSITEVSIWDIFQQSLLGSEIN